MKYTARVGERSLEVEIGPQSEVRVNGKARQVDLRNINGGPLFSILIDGRSHEVFVERVEGHYRALLEGGLHIVQVEDERTRLLGKAQEAERPQKGEVTVKAPMPGLVVAVRVAVGERVKVGDSLLILEAMKMENEIRAPQDGEVKAVRVAQGDPVEQSQALIVLD